MFIQLIIILLSIVYIIRCFIKRKENYKLTKTSIDKSNKIIYNLIKKNKNFSIARCGVGSEFVFAFDYMFNKKTIPHINLHNEAGIYFDESKNYNNTDFSYEKEEYSNLYLNAIRNCDYLAVWYNRPRNLNRELYYIKKYNLKHFPAQFLDISLYFNELQLPWTYALKNKTVLIIHPFGNLMKYQYKNKRKLLFKNKKILPKFKLKIIKPANTAGLNKIGDSWYDNYINICKEIDKIEFDIALVSCGGYGHPVINYIKKNKKKSAIYVGGSLQLLFGIKGKRWDNRSNFSKKYYNKHWIRPTDTISGIDRPDNIDGLKKHEERLLFIITK